MDKKDDDLIILNDTSENKLQTINEDIMVGDGIKIDELDNKSSFELVNLRQRTPSPYKMCRSLLHDRFSTDSLNSIQKKNESKNNEANIESKEKNKSLIKSIIILINHVLIQLSFLSILEPLLFFNYIITMEEDLFYDQVDSISKQMDDIVSEEMSQSIRSQPFYDPFIDFLVYEKAYIDGTFYIMEESAEQANASASEILTELKQKALHMAIIINMITLLFTSFVKIIYKKSVSKMIIHHLTLILFIGLFEIWFFTEIASKYFPWSSEEILFHLFQCFWINTTEKFPEFQRLQHNVTFSCEV